MNKKVLIISYAFPPHNTTIGARRWAKFTKYLIELGVEVHVLTTKRNKEISTDWISEIENVRTHYFSNNFPYLLHKSFNSRLEFPFKVIQYLIRKIIELYKGSIWMDEAIFDKKEVILNANRIIKENNINNVITTGPPHRINMFGAHIKKNNPQINFIIDYRDSWFDAKNYGYDNMTNHLKNTEINNELFTFSLCDKIICINEEFVSEINNRHNDKFIKKCIHIPHLLDDEDYLFKTEVSNNKKIVITYGGTITTSVLNNELDVFFKELRNYKINEHTKYNTFSFNFYTSNKVVKERVLYYKIEDIVKVKDTINEKSFFNILLKSNYLLAMLGREWKDYITTKQITYIPFRKPIILLSEKGKASKMLLDNELGIIVNNDNIRGCLNTIYDSSNKIKFNDKYDYSDYTYKKQIILLDSILK